MGVGQLRGESGSECARFAQVAPVPFPFPVPFSVPFPVPFPVPSPVLSGTGPCPSPFAAPLSPPTKSLATDFPAAATPPSTPIALLNSDIVSATVEAEILPARIVSSTPSAKR